jgi:hypothetical protein
VPGAFHHLAGTRIAILARLVRLDESGLNAMIEAATSMWTAVVERIELATEIEHHDGTPAHLDELASARRNLIDRSDDVFSHQIEFGSQPSR